MDIIYETLKEQFQALKPKESNLIILSKSPDPIKNSKETQDNKVFVRPQYCKSNISEKEQKNQENKNIQIILKDGINKISLLKKLDNEILTQKNTKRLSNFNAHDQHSKIIHNFYELGKSGLSV